jgi:hypothetical protein
VDDFRYYAFGGRWLLPQSPEPSGLARPAYDEKWVDAQSVVILGQWRNRMKRVAFLALLLGLLSGTNAVAQEVTYNYAQDVDFTKFKTYKWVSIKNSDPIDEITAKQLTAAIDAELARKDLTKTDSDNADLYIAYQTAVGSEKQLNAYQTGWGYGPGWRYGGGTSTLSATTTTIYVGQLDLDMYDAAKHDLVWRGTAAKTLNPKVKPDKRTKNINKGVEKLLKNYPPKAKK